MWLIRLPVNAIRGESAGINTKTPSPRGKKLSVWHFLRESWSSSLSCNYNVLRWYSTKWPNVEVPRIFMITRHTRSRAAGSRADERSAPAVCCIMGCICPSSDPLFAACWICSVWPLELRGAVCSTYETGQIQPRMCTHTHNTHTQSRKWLCGG